MLSLPFPNMLYLEMGQLNSKVEGSIEETDEQMKKKKARFI